MTIHLRPSQHDVAGRLKSTLPGDDALAIVPNLRASEREVWGVSRSERFLDLQEERVVVVFAH